jgi:glycosyltransferase involved in cell wall biosynthesis
MKRDLTTIFRIQPDKVSVIPHGICFEDRSTISAGEAKKKLGIREELVLLFFGLVRKYKGLDILLEAFGKIKDEFNVALLIAGDFVEGVEQYEDIIKRYGMKEKVYMHSRYIKDEEVPLFFSAANILVQPYRHFAGQSGVPPTAFHHSIPVIASHVGGLPEIVIHNQTGIIVEPDNTEQIANAIRFFLENPSNIEEYGKNGKSFLETELSWAGISEKMMTIYSDHLGR